MIAYGVCFTGQGLAVVEPLPKDVPQWRVEQRTGPVASVESVDIGTDDASIALPAHGVLRLDRRVKRVELITPSPVPLDTLLHPILGVAAAVIARWMGRLCLHASAVVVDGHAWALLGDRASGKSTTAAALVAAGAGGFTDDLLVVDDQRAFAGPPFYDLRADAAAVLGGDPLGRVGNRDRWRRSAAGHRVATVPLGGLVDLAWGDDLEVREVTPVERLAVLDAGAGLPIDPHEFLDLASVRMLRMSRQRDLSRLDAAARRLLGVLQH